METPWGVVVCQLVSGRIGPTIIVTMNEDESKISNSSLLRRIATRFSHLLSAQLVETVLSGVFFVYVAWLDSNLYGEIMYSVT